MALAPASCPGVLCTTKCLLSVRLGTNLACEAQFVEVHSTHITGNSGIDILNVDDRGAGLSVEGEVN